MHSKAKHNFACAFAGAMCVISAHAETRYVSLTGLHISPYTNWADASTNIQFAIDASDAGDLLLVTNGVYDAGEVVVHEGLINRVALTNAITVMSVNGPQQTVIMGRGPLGQSAIRCAYVGSNSTLAGFTLTNGHTRVAGASFTEQFGGGKQTPYR